MGPALETRSPHSVYTLNYLLVFVDSNVSYSIYARNQTNVSINIYCHVKCTSPNEFQRSILLWFATIRSEMKKRDYRKYIHCTSSQFNLVLYSYAYFPFPVISSKLSRKFINQTSLKVSPCWLDLINKDRMRIDRQKVSLSSASRVNYSKLAQLKVSFE